MKLSMKLRGHLKTKDMRELGYQIAEALIDGAAEEAYRRAKHNVSPGVGPGPHPHISSHTDTGELERSIKLDYKKAGFLRYANISTDLDYGYYLEAGWHTSTGRFVQYPWLTPAVASAFAEHIDEVSRIAKWMKPDLKARDFSRTVKAQLSVIK